MTIRVSSFFQIMGRPREYVLSSMEEVLDNLGKEKGVKIIKRTVHEPQEAEERKDIFSSFAEAEIEFEKIEGFFMMMFNYMPAHIEILSPSEWKMKISEFNTFVNELLRKLHQYDGLAKSFILEKNNMQNYIKELHEKLGNLSKELKLPKMETLELDLDEEKPEEVKDKTKKKSKKAKKSKK